MPKRQASKACALNEQSPQKAYGGGKNGGGDLPRGIAAMDVGSDYLSGFAHRVPSAATTVAGAFDARGPKDGSTIGFLRGVAPSAFQGQANDLVVATDSAAANPDDSPIVECDHFSHLKNEEALRAIGDAVAETLQGPTAALTRDLPVPAQPLGTRTPGSPSSEPEPDGRSVRW